MHVKQTRFANGILILLLSALCLAGCRPSAAFFTVEEGRIVRDGEPCYFIGTNVWYASQLALSDPARFTAELDALHGLGLDNLRILATDENFEGMDIVLRELEKRGMSAVLYLNNAWEWSPDGYRSWLEKAGAGRQPHPAVEGYGVYMSTMHAFASNPQAVALFQEHVRRVVERYKDSPAVFSWQICNEPRPFTEDPAKIEDFIAYLHGTARLIKSIDARHLVSTGNEGSMGSNGSIDLFTRVNDSPDIDYITLHIWPYNWSWVQESALKGEAADAALDAAIGHTAAYIDEHLEKAYDLRKPLVIEEFGFPRDGFEWHNDGPVTLRDRYYAYIFGRVLASARGAGRLAGCNFWTWSGHAAQNPEHQFWQEGDELAGDPPQEAQGLNGVYLSDESTIATIRSYTDSLSRVLTLWAPDPEGWMFYGDGPHTLHVRAASQTAADAPVTMALVRDIDLMGTQDTLLLGSRTAKVRPGRPADLDFNLGALEPGFYQVRLGKHQVFNIGVNPERIESPQDKQPDFDAFWERTLAELAAVPMDARMELVPEHSDSHRNSYRVFFKSLGGAQAGGILCVPIREGKYPVSLELMGYGAQPYWFDPAAEPDKIQFLVSVRGQGIFREPEERWIDRGLDSKEHFYYRGAFCDIVRAIDFVCTLDRADPERIYAWGDSQGGAFTWIAASLDHRVRAIAPSVPFLSDYPDYGRIVWWPMHEVFQAADAEGIGRDDLMRMLSYFDVKNFTDRVQCPVYMAFGLQDPTCPPHTNFAGYNQVTAPKQFHCEPLCGHAMWKESRWQQIRADFFGRN